MRKLIVAGISALVVAVTPSVALAQLQFDPTASPTRETGGWVYNAAQLMAFLGILTAILVWAGYMRWSPLWKARRAAKKAPAPAASPELAPVVPKPEPAPVASSAEPLPEEAAAASAESIGEAPPGAVAVADKPTDVYHDTLEELLSKGVPQKVAEARARAAAKKAGA